MNTEENSKSTKQYIHTYIHTHNNTSLFDSVLYCPTQHLLSTPLPFHCQPTLLLKINTIKSEDKQKRDMYFHKYYHCNPLRILVPHRKVQWYLKPKHLLTYYIDHITHIATGNFIHHINQQNIRCHSKVSDLNYHLYLLLSHCLPTSLLHSKLNKLLYIYATWDYYSIKHTTTYVCQPISLLNLIHTKTPWQRLETYR